MLEAGEKSNQIIPQGDLALVEAKAAKAGWRRNPLSKAKNKTKRSRNEVHAANTAAGNTAESSFEELKMDMPRQWQKKDDVSLSIVEKAL